MDGRAHLRPPGCPAPSDRGGDRRPSERTSSGWNGSLVEWQTRQLATVIASTVPVDKGKKNPLSKLVESIRLWPPDEEEAEKAKEPSARIDRAVHGPVRSCAGPR